MSYREDESAETSEAKPASHDIQPPPALLEFMLKGWKPAGKKPKAIKNAAVFQARRKALSRRFPGEVLVIPTGHAKLRSNDTHFRFRPGSDFYYLTGNLEADCVLVMLPEDGKHRDVLFVEPNPGHSNATFYTDRAKGELWVGPRLGVPESRIAFGMHECRGLPDLPALLSELAAKGSGWRLLRGLAEPVDHALPPQEGDAELTSFLHETRLIKDALEVRELQKAIDATKRGFDDVIATLRKGGTERHVEGVFNLRARVEGNHVGYGTIAAAGAHACILHWERNDGPLNKKELLLLDAGVEGNSLYTADVTRTFPIGGRFSKEQKEIYSLVLAAQAAALKKVKPGNEFLAPFRAAMEVLAHGLEALGILPTSAQDALAEEHQFYKRYSLHGVSHMLGLDVHDCAQARQESYKFGKLRAGMVLTVEPGLYFQVDDLTVPRKYRGIGVRIEDDVLVTAKGMKNLTKAFPSAPGDVEKWMAKVWRSAR